MPLSVTDSVEENRTRPGAEASGEDLAVVGEDLVGHSMGFEGVLECGYYRLGRGPQNQAGGHTEATVVVESTDHLELGAVGQVKAPDDVDLPELHRA